MMVQHDRDYAERGYSLVRRLIAPEIANAFLHQLQAQLEGARVPLSALKTPSNLVGREAIEIYGNQYAPMAAFLWGPTPTMCTLTGLDLLPTYCYFRLYREGDVCRVHSDRYSCEHSLSLTLDYSDGVPWDLEVGLERVEPSALVEETFGARPYQSLTMEPGDAVLYQGVHRRHARMTRNPNGWSAHLFLHWIDRNGPYSEYAFDKQPPRGPVRLKLD